MTDFRFPDDRVFFIAEVGPNHDGSLDNALAIIDRVAASGADAIKFQTYASARHVVARGAPLAEYMKAGDTAPDQEALLERIRLSYEDFAIIAEACAKAGILFASTPFDVPSVAALVALGIRFLKIPSGEITNVFLLRAAARTGLPLVVSTGMADIVETRRAADLIRAIWAEDGLSGEATPDLVLLQCTSAYPAPAEAANLRAMATLTRKLGLPAGYSDHTVGCEVAMAAAALGARVIEKHVTPDRLLPGPDHAASLPLDELPGLIASIRDIEAALGDGVKRPRDVEMDVKRVARRSLAASCDIAAGDILSESSLTALRPETGIPPFDIDRVAGRKARRAYREGELLDTDELGP